MIKFNIQILIICLILCACEQKTAQVSADYINVAKKNFQHYKSTAEKTISQLSENDLYWQYDESSNSISMIVNHLSGNMKSRWTDFLISDGEKEWRNRDLEFEPVVETKDELMEKWDQGWDALFNTLESLPENSNGAKVYIRNQEHTILEAINRQLCHYSYHVGQIVYVGKMIKGKEWQSLSIPKGKSEEFNKKKFAKGKH